jgi:hypothetical protein
MRSAPLQVGTFATHDMLVHLIIWRRTPNTAGHRLPAGHSRTGVAVTLQQRQHRFLATTAVHSSAGTFGSVAKSQLADAGAGSPATGTQNQNSVPSLHSSVLRVLGVAADAAADAVRAAERWPPGSLAQQARP